MGYRDTLKRLVNTIVYRQAVLANLILLLNFIFIGYGLKIKLKMKIKKIFKKLYFYKINRYNIDDVQKNVSYLREIVCTNRKKRILLIRPEKLGYSITMTIF